MFKFRCLLWMTFIHAVVDASVNSTSDIFFNANKNATIEATINEHGLGVKSTPTASHQLKVMGNAMFSGCLVVGGDQLLGSSNVSLNGSVAYGFKSVSANVTADQHNVYLLNTSSRDITVILPDASVLGREVRLKKTSTSNQAYVRSTSGCTIDGSEEMRLLSGNLSSATVFSDGRAWHAIEQYSATFGSNSAVVVAPSSVPTPNYYIPFNEGSGDVINESIVPLTGTRQNFETSGNGWVAGNVGGALEFDGVNDYLQMADNAALNSTGNMSIAFFVKFKTLSSVKGANQTFVRRSVSGAPYNAYLFQMLSSDDKIKVIFNDSASTYKSITGATALQASRWYHVALVTDSNLATLYLDGVSAGTATGHNGVIYSGTTLNLGAKYNGNEHAHVVLDDFRIYHRTLTNSEIISIRDQ
jgi:hypothetical protein